MMGGLARELIKILIACECSGEVRDAFRKLGFDATSCDIKPDEKRSNHHIQGNVLDYLDRGWDGLIVAHPPCTRLCNSGVRWLHVPPAGKTVEQMWQELDEGADFFSELWNAPIPHVAVENPVMHKHARERIRNFKKADQFVQPWWFGDPYFKATGLWLRDLAPLTPTNKLTPPVKGTEEHKRWSQVHRMPPGADRATERSRTYPGLASAMAEQWGAQIERNMERMAA